jgi:SpoVK/Ycf46/Vps4 family AAA+-type ATPase
MICEYPMLHERKLQRAENASDIPPLDRAIAQAICKLVIAQDRIPLDSTFFSRAVAACNGAFVWPESVLRYMENEQKIWAPSDGKESAKSGRRRALKHIKLVAGLDEAVWVNASALVDPDRLLAVRSACFNSFCMDAPMRLSMAHATLAWLSKAPDPSNAIPILRSATYMAHAFGMDLASTEVFKFMCLVSRSAGLKLVLNTLDCHSMETGVDILSRWIGSGQRADVEGLFSSNSVLVQTGMHCGFDTQPTDLEDVLHLGNQLILRQLQREHSNERAFLDSFLNASRPPALTTSDIPHLAAAHEMHRALLSNAAKCEIHGVNLLLYGDPGTGKTEYARLLAHEAGVKLYEIESCSPLGASAKPGQRLGMLMITLRALQHHPHTAVLFDEAEDFFEPPTRGDSRVFNNLSKAWLNQFLENTGAPVIWTSNYIDHIESSTLRRIMVLHEMRSPPANVRAKIAQQHFGPLGLDGDDIQNVAALPGLTPAQIEITAKTIQLAGPKDLSQARRWTQQHLTNSRKALGFSQNTGLRNSPVAFDPRYLNTHNGPSVEKLLQHLESEPAISLCLYGLPGTGKTEFARYISEQLGRDLIVRTASDLLSKWLGETEQRIAAMFESCSENPQDCILLLDEADTFLRTRQGARNTWEVSHTNEFLARMSLFPGTFICTTNLFGELDSAVLRRFQFRIQFDVMTDDQVIDMFERTFGLHSPIGGKPLKGLVPADFANVKRQLKFMETDMQAQGIHELLRIEAMSRQGQMSTHSPIGFF